MNTSPTRGLISTSWLGQFLILHRASSGGSRSIRQTGMGNRLSLSTASSRSLSFTPLAAHSGPELRSFLSEIGRNTSEPPIRSGRLCKSSHGAGCSQQTENLLALAVGVSKNDILVKRKFILCHISCDFFITRE